MMMSKYSANGNDFVIFHALERKDRTALAVEVCNRQNGIGADGLIVLIPNDANDFEWEFYNSDGSHADMCGNGSRAVAHYAYINELAGKNMSFLTGAGVINASIVKGHGKKKAIVKTELTPPKILDKEIESMDVTGLIAYPLIGVGERFPFISKDAKVKYRKPNIIGAVFDDIPHPTVAEVLHRKIHKACIV